MEVKTLITLLLRVYERLQVFSVVFCLKVKSLETFFGRQCLEVIELSIIIII